MDISRIWWHKTLLRAFACAYARVTSENKLNAKQRFYKKECKKLSLKNHKLDLVFRYALQLDQLEYDFAACNLHNGLITIDCQTPLLSSILSHAKQAKEGKTEK